MRHWQMQKAILNRALVASIHDVSPLTRVKTDSILRDLRGVGCHVTSLLVVPDHHRLGRISKDPEFAAWLRDRNAEGHEVVLHGFYHLREQQSGDGFFKKLVTQSYTAGEGEFFDLRKGEAMDRLKMGIGELAACGVKTSGFIAPAWLLGSEAEDAVRALGFEYTTRISTVSDFVCGRVYSSRSLVWSVRAPWRRVCSLAWNGSLFRTLRHAPLLRIGIHPPDWQYHPVRRQILKLTGAALAARQAMSYQQWLLQQRSQQT